MGYLTEDQYTQKTRLLTRRIAALEARNQELRQELVQYHIDSHDCDSLDELVVLAETKAADEYERAAAFSLLNDAVTWDSVLLSYPDVCAIISASALHSNDTPLAADVLAKAERLQAKREADNTCPNCGRPLDAPGWVHQRQVDICDYRCYHEDDKSTVLYDLLGED